MSAAEGQTAPYEELLGVGRRIADDVISFAHANNVTQIIIGKSTRARWFEMLHGSVVHDLLRKAGNISVHVIAAAGETAPAKPARTLAITCSRSTSHSTSSPPTADRTGSARRSACTGASRSSCGR